jgi:hydroxymethylbilane synthase
MNELVIATRGSALALWQAEHVAAALRARSPGLVVRLAIIKTQGDKILDVALAKVGGKGLFVKEIEQALVDRTADVAVHSMKDVPSVLADGLAMAAVSAGESPLDALCVRGEPGAPDVLTSLPRGAVVGTSSMRRQCQLLARRPDLQIKLLRGNVPTRLAKLDAGDYDAIVLAAAGLTRLGLAHRISQRLDPEVCLPAVAQGVLGVEVRADDDRTAGLVRAAMHDEREAQRVTAERAFQRRMGGSCDTPLAAFAQPLAQAGQGDQLRVDGMCGSPDGTVVLRQQVTGPAASAEALGVELAERLLAAGAAALLAPAHP